MLTDEQIALIKDNQQQSIQDKTLTREQLELFYTNKWFNLWVPKELHGLGYDFVEGCQLLEEVAYHDGGLAWTLTLCAGANMFAGFIDPALATGVFANPKVCFGGSGRPSGRAEWIGDAYRISGSWKYATGTPHLTHFTLNAFLFKDGVALLDSDGNPQYSSFFIDRDDVLMEYDWDTFGLEATASHSFSVVDLVVEANRAFTLSPEARKSESLIYKYPFISFAEATLCVNYMGMFARFLAVVEKEFLRRAADSIWNRDFGKSYLKELDAMHTRFMDDRRRLYTILEDSWEALNKGEEDLSAFCDQIASACRALVAALKEDTFTLYQRTGIKGAQRQEELNICFRNLFTATQHSLLNN